MQVSNPAAIGFSMLVSAGVREYRKLGEGEKKVVARLEENRRGS